MTAQAGDANSSSHTRPMTAQQRSDLRSRLRTARRNLSPADRRHAATGLARRIARLPEFRRARLVAVYFPHDGEIDPTPLLEASVRLGKRLCVPAIDRPRPGDMSFLRYAPGDPLRENRYGIPEPIARKGNAVSRRDLDLVLAPLVAFDETGNRIGMGGGYYDRHFSTRRGHRWRHPVLIGVAYEMQNVGHVPTASWDVPLDAIATECRVYR